MNEYDVIIYIKAKRIENGNFKIDVSASGYITNAELVGIYDIVKNKTITDVVSVIHTEKTKEIEDLEPRDRANYYEHYHEVLNLLHRQKKMSNRLFNLLTNPAFFKGMKVGELTEVDYFKFRNCGQKSWDEFLKLRGF